MKFSVFLILVMGVAGARLFDEAMSCVYLVPER